MKKINCNIRNIKLSDQDVRLRCLEIVSNHSFGLSPFMLIAQSVSLYSYVKTGRYNMCSGDANLITTDLQESYLTSIYEKVINKREEPQQTANNTNNEANISKHPFSFIRYFLRCFRGKHTFRQRPFS